MAQNSEALLERFHCHRVEFVVIGGFCGVLYGVTLVTKDVDVCCRFSGENLRRLEAAVRDLHPVHRMTPNRLPLELTEELCGRLNNLYLHTDFGTIDCLSEVAGLGDFSTVLARSVPVEFAFGECRVLSIDALIQAKETAGRPHDLIAVRMLRAIKERLHNDR
jgi:hypothetical protein